MEPQSRRSVRAYKPANRRSGIHTTAMLRDRVRPFVDRIVRLEDGRVVGTEVMT